MSTATVSPIEFATNRQGNTFAVIRDYQQFQQILSFCRDNEVIHGVPQVYKPDLRWVIYFKSATDALEQWLKQNFNIKNTTAGDATQRIKKSHNYDCTINKARAALDKYSIDQIKTAMKTVIGNPTYIKGQFVLAKIKTNGCATKIQCIELIACLGVYSQIARAIKKQQQPVSEPKPEPELGTELAEMFKAVDSIMDKPIYQDTAIVPYIEAVEAEIVEDDEIEIDTEEFINALVGSYINQYALPAGVDKQSAYPIDFDPHTVEELNQRSVTKALIIKICAEHGIDVDKKTQRLNKLDLINHILPALNAAALAAHLA